MRDLSGKVALLESIQRVEADVIARYRSAVPSSESARGSNFVP